MVCRHFLRTSLAGLVLALWPGCNGEESASCENDASLSDMSQCKKSSVQCKPDEINAFGLCLTSGGMAKVSAGMFTMGYTESGKDHSPAHKVTLKEYLIDLTEVTVAQYRACVDCGVCARPLRDGSHTGREPYYGNAKYDRYPVIYVSHTDARTYCEAIGKRLPTEAEWEKAARGTAGNTYPWGSDAPTTKHANFGALVNDTTAVSDYADKGKSPYGVLNMAGNVWEWVQDSYDAGYYSRSPAADPAGPTTKVTKVMRGGGFITTYDRLKTYIRASDAETASYSSAGFRCAAATWQANP